MRTQHIAIAGSAGRMGRTLMEAIAQSADFRLKSALEREGSPFVGRDAGEIIGTPNGVLITADLDAALAVLWRYGPVFNDQVGPCAGKRRFRCMME